MIRKLAVIVTGVLLFAGVAFGLSVNNRDGFGSDIFGLGNHWAFVCTPQAIAPGSRATKQYTANLAELQRLQTRRVVLQSDINVVENTCKNLKNKPKIQCQKNVAELRIVEKRLAQLNIEIGQYQDCKANDIIFSYPKTRLSFSPYRSTAINTVVPGTVGTLGDWTVLTNKGTAAINYLQFQMVNTKGDATCDIFGEYELRDVNDTVLSVGKVSDSMVRFDFSPTFIANTTPMTIKLVGSGAPTRGEGHFDPKECIMEMRPSDMARSRIETEGDNSGFGPYGLLYDVVEIPTTCTDSDGKDTITMGESWGIKGIITMNVAGQYNTDDLKCYRDADGNMRYTYRIGDTYHYDLYANETGITFAPDGKGFKFIDAKTSCDIIYTIIPDTCEDSMTIREGTCTNDDYSYDYYSCMYGCLDGACLPKPLCVDTDNGIDFTISGTAYVGNDEGIYFESQTDMCGPTDQYHYPSLVPENSVVDYYCDNQTNSINYSIFSCENGCSNGACI